MPPIQLHSNWNQRPSDSETLIEPLKKYFIICEGENTESFYFKKLINLKKEIGIHSLIDIVFIEKTDEDKNLSYPKKLLEFTKSEREKLITSGHFEIDRDVIVITFDLDVFNERVCNLDDILKQQDENLLFGIAYPDFELFLLLHIEDTVDNVIIPNETMILENKKIGKQRPCQALLQQVTGINSKKNKEIGELAKNVDIAIKQEKLINQNLDFCLTNITSNIASIIEKIKDEKFPF